MRAIRIGSRGQRVKEVQLALMRAGYALPKWGADGDLGWETWTALMSFAEDRGLSGSWPDAEVGEGSVPSTVLDALFPAVEGEAKVPDRFFDVTRLHPLRKGRKRPRKPTQVTSIVLHQTACRLGTTHARWYNVACHVGVPSNGDVVYVNDLLAYVWHANGANRFSVGVEIDGRFEGIEGKLKTLWGHKKGRTPDALPPRQLKGAREAVRWIVEYGRSIGCPITKIYAHRQFSNMRRSDPGSLIWQQVGLWAQEELGLVNRRTYTLDTGLEIPYEWDDRSETNYYGRKRKRR